MKLEGDASSLALFGLVAGAGLTVAHEGTAHACSCVGPALAFLSPVRADAAPLNTHVRLEVPNPTWASTFVLRAHRGAAVPTRAEVLSGGGMSVVDLTPLAPLAAVTRYEVATVDPNTHPSTTVIGTFKTGTAVDTTPPRLDSVGKVTTHLNLGMVGGGTCSIRGPWITLSGYAIQDPGRKEASLAFAIWTPDSGGKLDTNLPPDTLLFPFREEVSIGQTSLCDPRSFPLNGPTAQFAIAVVDEAGNKSGEKRFRADLTRPSP
jgi:hypothetical protein